MQNFWGVNKVYYGNVKVANKVYSLFGAGECMVNGDRSGVRGC